MKRHETPGEPAPIDDEREADLGAQVPGAELEAELVASREETVRAVEEAARWQAEFENFRRRQAAQSQDQALRASGRVVERLFPVIDDLDRAVEHAVGGGDLEHLLKGVEMVSKQIMDVLGREGVEIIDPFGQPFDPNLHHAVNQVEDREVPEHTVVEVFQKGYSMNGRVLRPAMVVVSSGGPERAQPAQE
ncbi:MAG: nucleotide exchange factor GrpE [Coriobacteriia bacterium]|nr:nucleotide exchange factor GrpE [Coriobacteriia bacterium]